MPDLLEVRDVTKAFDGVVANRDISLHVAQGTIVGLIGPNGSGKTTLFNVIAGTHAVDSGSIWFGGRDISHLRVPQIARLGLARTFQQTRVFGNMSCRQNLLVSGSRAGESWLAMWARESAGARARADSLLRLVGLHARPDWRAGSLSFGQQKLLELAMALMNEPRILLLDEPTAGINPAMVDELVALLRRVNAESGVTLLVIEHNMHVIAELAGYVYCLAHGKLLAEGEPEQILRDPEVIEAYLGGQ
ncbi:ABC transporter ATP-binding protein [Cupriavidus sp. UYMMa02A]|nr:ABC transporter ATP-binding protein [Cupriavidus sp. UYMMa02A]